MSHQDHAHTELAPTPCPWRFELIEAAGKGASGTVFRSRDSQTNRTVAIKVAHDQTSATILAHEAETLMLANSPFVPAVIDIGRIPSPTTMVPTGTAYIALDWAAGTRLCPTQIPESLRHTTAEAVARDIGAALDDLHQAGLAHGDVKPDNIMIRTERDGIHAMLVDLGYSSSAGAEKLVGATPRYAPPELAQGEWRPVAHDVWALGLCLAEIIDESIARSTTPVDHLWDSELPQPWSAWLRALTAPQPAARPSASWIRTISESLCPTEKSASHGSRVRASYLRVRRPELLQSRTASSVEIADDTAAWLSDAVAVIRSAQALRCESDSVFDGPAFSLKPLDSAARKRWIVALVGVGAAGWSMPASFAEIPERVLAVALENLARFKDPSIWTIPDLTRAAGGISGSTSGGVAPGEIHSTIPRTSESINDLTELALALVKRPALPAALRTAEESHNRGLLPTRHRVLLAEALRAAGDLGRAFAALDGLQDPMALIVRADLLRRMGNHNEAIATATTIESDGNSDISDRAASIHARALLDLGKVDEAVSVVGTRTRAAAAEVQALARLALSDSAAAKQAIDDGLATAVDDEERARLFCVRGMEAHARGDSGEAYASFRQAAESASRAGAVVEEATYQTGVAAAAVDSGLVDAALDASMRSTMLWEHLRQPGKVAYSMLARASAFAVIGCAHDGRNEAVRALPFAEEAQDRRATAYLLMLLSDLQTGEEQTKTARRSLDALGSEASLNDILRARARMVCGGLGDEDIHEMDRRAESAGVSVTARTEWWTARARAWMQGRRLGRDSVILSELLRLVREPMPIGVKGPGVDAGRKLAAAAGDGEIARTLTSLQVKLSIELLEHVPSWLRQHAVGVPWILQARGDSSTGSSGDRARHLEMLVRSMGERETLRQVLDRALDALVFWTGVERGLLLLNAPGNKLAVRAARNLERRNIRGEQIELSQSLARRALKSLEPVVAVDATGELAELHRSVHVLGLRSVLAVPLLVRGEALGVAYLDDRVRIGAFGPEELSWVRLVAGIAAMAIADARAHVLLRREARKASRAEIRVKAELERREAELEQAQRALATEKGRPGGYESLVGDSAPMKALLSLVNRVAPTGLPVLVQGESGCGKELVARAMHKNSPRSSGPFVAENCSAIPETLFESTLFGHVRGAFTGADRRRLGLFEAADGGTLFLDEVGEIPLQLQGKLLRVLQDGEVHSLGSSKSHRVDVRIVAATNRDLRELVQAGSFREDLFYRLNVVAIRVPSLRERIDDIPILVQHFLVKHGSGVPVKVSRRAWSKLESYSWPGNIRELENEIRRALALCDGVIREDDLSSQLLERGTTNVSAVGSFDLKTRVDALERELVERALEKTAGNQTRAAALLGVSRFGLQKMIKRLGVS